MDFYSLKKLCDNADCVEFFPGCLSEELIGKAEKEFSIKLPASYKWWLQNYDGGSINELEILGIDPENVGKPDILSSYKKRTLLGHDSTRLFFTASSGDQDFYFRINEMQNDEYPIYVLDHSNGGEEKKYADSFSEFIEKFINEPW